MNMTKLIYLDNMQQLKCISTIKEIIKPESGNISIILDQTVFYPQGGGQPYDIGIIFKNEEIMFKVDEVRFIDEKVHHFGSYINGSFNINDQVHCEVEENRRNINTRYHSAGHLIDMGLHELGKLWKPEKGYHFPNGAYVEYELAGNSFEDDSIKALENKCNEIIKRKIETSILFIDKSEMGKYCNFVPDYLPTGKPSRLVLYGNFGIPCGGTHCKNLSEIKGITIRKIKKEKGAIRVSYSVND